MSYSGKKDNSIKLLFFDNLDSPKSNYNVFEIFFKKAVNIKLFRILKPDSNPHAKYKSVMSKTQKDIIYNFDIFGRNLKKIDDKFELIFKCDNINKTNGETDNLFPLIQEFITNQIVIRGKFESITLCIYGTTCNNTENAIYMEQSRNDIPLEKIEEQIQMKKKNKNDNSNLLSKEEENLIAKYPIEKLLEGSEDLERGYLEERRAAPDMNPMALEEENCAGGAKTFLEINHIDKENKNMTEKTKTGYIFYENDLKKIIESLLNFYNLDDKNISEKIILEHHFNFKKLFNILEILIDRNKAHLEDDCVFNKKNLEIFSFIPENIVEIVLMSLKGLRAGETEIKNGLKLLKYVSNCESFVKKFIECNGMKQLYNIILLSTEHPNIKKGIIPSLILKILALENIYKLITYKCTYQRLLDTVDKNDLEVKDTIIVDKVPIDNLNKDDNSKNKNRDRSKERGKDKGKERREKEKERESRHRRKSKSRHSSSESNSRYRSRSKSVIRKNSEEPKRREKVQFTNGLQILSSLLISKKNILLTNIMKNITKKLNLIQYLKNLNELIYDYISNLSSGSEKVNNLNRIQYHLHEIIKFIQKLETPYRAEKTQNPIQKLNIIEEDYPFKYYWIDYFDLNKKYYNKNIIANEKGQKNNHLDESNNEEYINRNCLNKYNPKYENIIITNEISELFEQYDFYNNLLTLLSCPSIQKLQIFYPISIQIKNIISLLSLNIGGINYLSKNYETTTTLLDTINKIIDKNIPDYKDYCFRKIKIQNFIEPIEDTNDIINNKFSEILIPSQKIEPKDDELNDLYIQINYLQLFYLLDYSNKFIHLFDDLSNILDSFKSNSVDIFNFRNKSFYILFNLNSKIEKCELGKQAFLSLINNKFVIDIFMKYLEYISELTDEIYEYEAHISLIISILYQIISSTDNHSAFFLFFNKITYDYLKKIQNNIYYMLEKSDKSIDNKLTVGLEGLIACLKNLENTSVGNLLDDLKNNIYNNILKYNLKETTKTNLKDDKLKKYIEEEYKLLVYKFNNDDLNYLGELNKNGSLLNSIYLTIKLLDINFKINPILLIEGESNHIHIMLKYLVINTTNSLNYLLNQHIYKQDDNSSNIELINIMLNDDNMNFTSTNNNQTISNKNMILFENENIINLANFLYYIYDIFCLLLNNLLSSHVDHYRNEDIIEHLLLNISTCFNFLMQFYCLKKKNFEIGVYQYKKINAIQNLFDKSLEFFHEICQFNTTIKLRFNEIIDKFFSVPENIPAKLFIINFILNNNTNEYTIDHFVDVFLQEVKKVNDISDNNNINYEDSLMYSYTEMKKIDAIDLKLILSHCDKKNNNFLEYIIKIGMITNDDFIKFQCAQIILDIFHKFTLKGNVKIFQDIIGKFVSKLKNQYEYFSKINCLYFEDNDYDIYIPKIRNLFNCLKFINVLIASDIKFLFIFQEVEIYYTNIFKYIQNFISNKIVKNSADNISKKEELLSNYIYDITLILLEGFKSLLNHRKNFEERYFFENRKRYNIFEELPNGEHIKNILIELNKFSLIIKNVSQILLNNNTNSNTLANKTLVIINKVFEVYLNLSTNFLGQSQLFENISLCEFISGLKSLSNTQINPYLSLVIISLIKLTLALFHDLDYYEYKKDESEGRAKFVISKQRLINLYKMFISSSATFDKNDENLGDKIIPSLYEVNDFLITLLQNEKSCMALDFIQYLQNLLKEYKDEFKDKNILEVINIEKTSPPPQEMRELREKLELIHIYYYFKSLQGLGNECKLEINDKKIKNINYSEVISTLNGTINNNINFNQKTTNNDNNEFNRSQIHEFEKLLNWKKARIFMNEYNNLKIRTTNFNIDSYIFPSDEFFEFKFYQLKKKYFYMTNDPFEQYCNSIEYKSNVINQFKNLSSFAFDTICTKKYLFGDDERCLGQILELFFINNKNEKINLEELNELVKEIKQYKSISDNWSSGSKKKKKIKSQINKFIYRQKYDKQQNNNIAQIRSAFLMNANMAKFSGKISGRTLSTHVDNVNPEKKIVNVTYNNTNVQPNEANPTQQNNQNNTNVQNSPTNNQNTNGNNLVVKEQNEQNKVNQTNLDILNNQASNNSLSMQSGNLSMKNIGQINNINNMPIPVNNNVLAPQGNNIQVPPGNMNLNNQANVPKNNFPFALLNNLQQQKNVSPAPIPIINTTLNPNNIQEGQNNLGINPIVNINPSLNPMNFNYQNLSQIPQNVPNNLMGYMPTLNPMNRNPQNLNNLGMNNQFMNPVNPNLIQTQKPPQASAPQMENPIFNLQNNNNRKNPQEKKSNQGLLNRLEGILRKLIPILLLQEIQGRIRRSEVGLINIGLIALMLNKIII